MFKKGKKKPLPVHQVNPSNPGTSEHPVMSCEGARAWVGSFLKRLHESQLPSHKITNCLVLKTQ